MVIQAISGLLIISGLFLGFTAALGLFRLPDFYSRIHAAGIADTFSAALILFGMMLDSGFSLITIKLLFIFALLWLTSPISSHSLVKAANQSGLKPIVKQ